MLKKLLLAVAFSLSASSAFAVCSQIPLNIKDASANTVAMSSASAGDGNCKTYIDADTASQIHTDLTAAVPVTKNGSATGVTGATPGTAQTGTQVNMDTGLNAVANTALGTPTNFGTSPGAVVVPGANASLFYGTTASVADPCQTATKVYTPVNVVTATNVIITAVAAKKKYICGIFLYPGGTDNIAVYQATTATSCATAAADIFGGHTTGTGFLATATAGFVVGNGASAIAATNTVNTDICITTSAAVQLSGVVVTVDQ